jgi:hypothetical protein
MPHVTNYDAMVFLNALGVFRKAGQLRLKPLIPHCQNQGLHKILITLITKYLPADPFRR